MAAKSKIINEDLTKNKLKKFNLYSYYYVRSPNNGGNNTS